MGAVVGDLNGRVCIDTATAIIVVLVLLAVWIGLRILGKR